MVSGMMRYIRKRSKSWVQVPAKSFDDVDRGHYGVSFGWENLSCYFVATAWKPDGFRRSNPGTKAISLLPFCVDQCFLILVEIWRLPVHKAQFGVEVGESCFKPVGLVSAGYIRASLGNRFCGRQIRNRGRWTVQFFDCPVCADICHSVCCCVFHTNHLL